MEFRGIKQNTIAFRSKLSPGKYHVYRNCLDNSLRKFTAEKTGRVAFLGGSITYNPGWRDSICIMLQSRFPGTSFEFIKAGIPSLGSVPDAFRLYDDVLSKGKIDLLFVEAAVNDRTNGYPDVAQVRAMEGIIREARKANPYTDIIFMYFVDPEKMKDYNDGIIPQEILNHEKVAAHYGIPSVNLAKEVTERIFNKEFTWEGDFRNLHPSPFGQQVYYHSIAGLLESCYREEHYPKTVNELPTAIDLFSYDSGKLIPVSSKDATNGWTYLASWEPSDKVSTREGYVRSPMLVATDPGKILSYNFKGNAIGIAAVSGPDAGIIEYSIDRQPWKKVDLFTQWSNSVHLPWFLTLGDALKNGSHNLRIRLTDDNSNHPGLKSACRIRYFYVNVPSGNLHSE
jgi:sialidase-1